MAHTHSYDGSTTQEGMDRHRKALRMLVVVLIPLAIWTVAGLIVLWPGNVESHIQKDLSQYTVTGVTYPTAKITNVQEVSCEGVIGSTPGVANQTCATVGAQLLDGPEKGQTVEVQMSNAIYASGAKIGQDIKLLRLPIDGAPPAYQFSDFERRFPLGALAILFAVAVVAVARWRGFASLLGLVFAGFILVKFMFPALIAGSDPLLVGLIGSSAIMFVVLYAAHGFSARTTTALVGTLFGLVLSALMGFGASKWAHLTGVTSEDDYVLAATAPDLSLTSVVICGIILAGLGVLNDVTITQASAVWELADSDPDQKNLFTAAMRIGRDHIASTVYTLVFATAGASLPVLLLIAIYDRPLLQVLQTEMFASEIIRTVVGSIGLVLAVPLTTAIGVAVVRASSRGKSSSTRPASTTERPKAVVTEPVTATTAALSPAEGPESATPEAEKPQTEKPQTEKPQTGKPMTGKPMTPVADKKPRRRRKAEEDDFEGFGYLKDDQDDADDPRSRRSH